MKKQLRVLLLLLALGVLMLLVSTTAFAQTETGLVNIPEVSIQVGELIPGQALPAPTIPADVGYTIDSWQWYQKVASKAAHITQSDIRVTTCQDHNIYTLKVYLRTSDGYAFVYNSAEINGESPNETSTISNGIYSVSHTWCLKELIHRVDLVYDIPEAGTAIEEFYLSPAEYGKVTLETDTVSTSPDANKFQDNVQYRFHYEIFPTETYAFSEDLEIYANGILVSKGGARWDAQRFTLTLNYRFKIASVAFPAFPESVEPGSPGGIADLGNNGLYSDPKYIMRSGWIDMRTGQIVQTLEPGDVYALMYTATTDPSCYFSEDATVTVGGESVEYTRNGEIIVIYKFYDLGAQKLDKVEITLPQLYKGSRPSEATVPEGANYWVEEILLAESTTGSFQDAVPVAGASYGTHVYAIPVVVAQKGYAFGEDVKLFFNGQEVTAEYQMTEGPYLEIAGYYGVLTAPTTDGWHVENNSWALYENGEKVKNTWLSDEKGWRYLNADGVLVLNGFAKDSVGTCYLGADGYMITGGWFLHDGSWYYVNQNGYLRTNSWIRDSVDWCYVGADGKMYVEQWAKDSVGWCYLGADGYMVRNSWAADSLGICRLDSNGYILKNQWVYDSTGWAFVDQNGYAVYEGWRLDSKGWCYIYNYYMLTDAWAPDSKGICRVGPDGYILKNQWVYDGTGWAYVDKDGYVVFNQFVKDSHGTCYIGSSGYMLKGQHIEVDSVKYYIDSNGYAHKK